MKNILEEQLIYVNNSDDQCQSWYLHHILTNKKNDRSVTYGGVFVFYNPTKTFRGQPYITFQGIARHPIPYIITQYLPQYHVILPSLNAALQRTIGVRFRM